MTRLQSVERIGLGFLAGLCSTYTPSGSEALLVPALVDILERLGARVLVRDAAPGRPNVFARWGTPLVLFTTHIDVVPPDLPVLEREGVLRARGAVDAKGQIAAQLGAIARLLADGHRDVAWLGVCGEESDSAGARAAAEFAPELASCRAIVNGEPTGCRPAAGQRGYLRARLSCAGVAAHGSAPELGHSAVADLVSWLHALASAPKSAHPALGRESLNVGLVGGGRAANVVADAAWAEVDVRTVPGGALRPALESSKPASGSIEILVDEPWDFFHVPEGFTSTTVPFGSDLPLLREYAPGAAAILAGPGDWKRAHTQSESITGDELERGVDLFESIARRYLPAPVAKN